LGGVIEDIDSPECFSEEGVEITSPISDEDHHHNENVTTPEEEMSVSSAERDTAEMNTGDTFPEETLACPLGMSTAAEPHDATPPASDSVENELLPKENENDAEKESQAVEPLRDTLTKTPFVVSGAEDISSPEPPSPPIRTSTPPVQDPIAGFRIHDDLVEQEEEGPKDGNGNMKRLTADETQSRQESLRRVVPDPTIHDLFPIPPLRIEKVILDEAGQVAGKEIIQMLEQIEMEDIDSDSDDDDSDYDAFAIPQFNPDLAQTIPPPSSPTQEEEKGHPSPTPRQDEPEEMVGGSPSSEDSSDDGHDSTSSYTDEDESSESETEGDQSEKEEAGVFHVDWSSGGDQILVMESAAPMNWTGKEHQGSECEEWTSDFDSERCSTPSSDDVEFQEGDIVWVDPVLNSDGVWELPLMVLESSANPGQGEGNESAGVLGPYENISSASSSSTTSSGSDSSDSTIGSHLDGNSFARTLSSSSVHSHHPPQSNEIIQVPSEGRGTRTFRWLNITPKTVKKEDMWIPDWVNSFVDSAGPFGPDHDFENRRVRFKFVASGRKQAAQAQPNVPNASTEPAIPSVNTQDLPG